MMDSSEVYLIYGFMLVNVVKYFDFEVYEEIKLFIIV